MARQFPNYARTRSTSRLSNNGIYAAAMRKRCPHLASVDYYTGHASPANDFRQRRNPRGRLVELWYSTTSDTRKNVRVTRYRVPAAERSSQERKGRLASVALMDIRSCYLSCAGWLLFNQLTWLPCWSVLSLERCTVEGFVGYLYDHFHDSIA